MTALVGERGAARTTCAPSSHATRGNFESNGFNRIRNPKKRLPRRIKLDKTFDGFVFPMRRIVHLHDASGVASQRFAPITIDLAAVTVDRE